MISRMFETGTLSLPGGIWDLWWEPGDDGQNIPDPDRLVERS